MPTDKSDTSPDGSEDQTQKRKRRGAAASAARTASAKAGAGQKGSRRRTANGAQNSNSGGLELLQAHRAELRSYLDALKQFSADSASVRQVRMLCSAWSKYALLANEAVLPAFKMAGVETERVDESIIEHDLVMMILADLVEREPDDEFFVAGLQVMKRLMKSILDREEQKSRGLFAKAKNTELDLESLGQELQAMMSETWFKAEDFKSDLKPRLLRGAGLVSKSKEFDYMRGQDRDRDEYGRFVSDDERGGSNRGSRGMRGYDDNRRGSSRNEDDYRSGSQRSSSGRGRGQDYYDERGSRSQSSQGGRGQSEDYGSSSRGGRRTGGWFGDSEGHSEASRRGWDNPNHGDSGWFGDSEGHSEASRRGWRNPDHGDSGWFGDSEGHSRAARRGWDNPDHGESGWFGDSEGHSEASRRGWEGRRRDDDDDYGSRRGGSRGSSGRSGGRGRGGYDD